MIASPSEKAVETRPAPPHCVGDRFQSTTRALHPTVSTSHSITHNPCTHTPTTCLRVETPGLGRRDSKGHERICSLARNCRPTAATAEHEAQHDPTCARPGPSWAPKARRAPRAEASASTRRRLGQPRPQLRPQHALRAADGPRKRATARHAMTLHPQHSADLTLETENWTLCV